MRKALRFISRTLCLLATAVGGLMLLLAACFICVMGIVQFKEGRLLPEDRQHLGKAAIWFLSSCAIIGAGWWLSCQVGGKDDDSFRLTKSATGQSEKLAQPASQLLFFIISALWFCAITPANSVTKLAAVIGWLSVIYFGLHFRVFLHELAHLGAAWSLGFRLKKIQVGDGPRIGSVCLGNGLRCELRLWPHGGLVFAAPCSTRHFIKSQIVFVAAGPLMDALLLWVGYRFIRHGFGGLADAFLHGPSGLAATILFWSTAMSAVGGLIPHRIRIAGNSMPTDGYLLLQLVVPGLRTTRFGLNPDSAKALALLQSSSSAKTFALDSKSFAAAPAFREQQSRLASRLLPAIGIKGSTTLAQIDG